MKRNKGNDNFNLHTNVVTCYVAQLIRARARTGDFSEGIGSNPEFFSLFFFLFFFLLSFFYSSSYYLFVNRKYLFVDLSRRTMLVRSAASNAGFDIFPVYLTTHTGQFFFVN